jgi:uncharacterized membrane-anchored protein
VQAGQVDSARALADASAADSILDPRRELSLLAAIVAAETGDTAKAVRFLDDVKRAHLWIRPPVQSAVQNLWSITPLAFDPRFVAFLNTQK